MKWAPGEFIEAISSHWQLSCHSTFFSHGKTDFADTSIWQLRRRLTLEQRLILNMEAWLSNCKGWAHCKGVRGPLLRCCYLCRSCRWLPWCSPAQDRRTGSCRGRWCSGRCRGCRRSARTRQYLCKEHSNSPSKHNRQSKQNKTQICKDRLQDTRKLSPDIFIIYC